jgi:tetratricopeptide (TPR) repeat protein
MTMSESHSLDRRSAACLALLILLLWNDRGDAYQGNTFFVNGTIVDEAGGPVFQANLTLERFGSSFQRSGFTNNEGRFSFERLAEGTYTLRVIKTGFKDHSELIELVSAPRHLRIVLSRTDQEKRRQATPSGQAVVAVSTLRAPAKARKEYEQAAEAQRRGDNPAAHKHADKAIEIYPEFADAYALEGLVYLQEQQLEQAQAAFEKALSIEPLLPDGLLGLGRLRNSQRRFADAEDYLLQAAKTSPEAWQVNCELGRAYLGLGKNAEAERYLRQARAANPSYPPVYYLFAQVLLLLERPLEAVPEMEAYLRLAPRGPAADHVRDVIRRIKARQAGAGAAGDPMAPTS